MNLWLRLFWLIVTARWRPRLAPPFAVSRLRFRVWPHDLDTSGHMNNGRYWTLMDLGRTDLIVRTGLWRAVLRERWTPVLGGASVRFRRELRLFRTFTVETTVLCWSEAALVMEHRVLARARDGQEVLAAVALARVGLYDRAGRRFVPVSRLMEVVGLSGESPAPTPAVAAFLAGVDALRPVRPDGR